MTNGYYDLKQCPDCGNSLDGCYCDKMKNQYNYSQYKCPYEHLKKECGHELKGPEEYEDVYGVWCPCGFRGPVFYLDPKDLNLKKK